MNMNEIKEYIQMMNSRDSNIYQYVYARKIMYQPWQELIENYEKLSTEEIRDKFIEVMLSPNRVWGFKMLDKYGILKNIIPEFEDTKGMRAGNKYHHPEKDIFIHIIAALSHLKRDSSIELILATMLHDIGKPSTFHNHHFYNHDQIGAEMSEIILTRLRFHINIIQKVKWLILNHMRIRKFNEMKESKKIKLLEHKLFSQLLKLLDVDIMTNNKKILDDIQKFKSKQYYKED